MLRFALAALVAITVSSTALAQMAVSSADDPVYNYGLPIGSADDFTVTLTKAQQNNPAAMVALASTYETGAGAPKNEIEARRWYLMAAERGVTDAMDRLGIFYEQGIGGPKDAAKALYWSHRAWRSAPDFYIDRYPSAQSMAAERVAIFRQLQTRAKRDPEAMHLLGVMYEEGHGTPKDPVTAAVWYRRAANRGHLPALTALSDVMSNNKGHFEQWEQGEVLLEQAARKGDLTAITRMGIYNDLRGMWAPLEPVGQNRLREAARWYRLGADQGGVIATGRLGRLYRWGLGVPEDDVEALRLLRLAADANHVDAMREIAAMYEKGEAVSQSAEEAARWRCLVMKRQSRAATVSCP